MDVELLEESMCSGLSIGVESGSEKILRLVGKRYTIADVLDVFDRVEATSIKLKLFFMVGLPEENQKDIEQTRALIRACRAYHCIREINIFQFKPYPGTALYTTYFQHEEVTFLYHDLRESHAHKIVSLEMEKAMAKDTYFCRHRLLWMPLEDLQEMIVDMYCDFYAGRA